jgi:hypothetical protein
MIFKQVDEVLDGTKTQTRRVAKRNDWFTGRTLLRNGRRKWKIGGIYAIQPGRSKPQVGKIQIMKIRKERLQVISNGDLRAEGITTNKTQVAGTMDMLEKYKKLWNSLNKDSVYKWKANPEVWVLEFRCVNKRSDPD